jgi:hypothetical protein
MAVLSRSALLSKLNSLINDNNAGDVEPSELREVLVDIRDSAVWQDEGVRRDETATLVVGYTTESFNISAVSGTVTPVFANGQVQTFLNNGAFTLAAPTGEGSMRLEVTNGPTAGAVSFSGFTDITGAFTTTNGHRFRATIERIGSNVYVDIEPAASN